MDAFSSRVAELIHSAEQTIGSLVHPAELDRRRKNHLSNLNELRNTYISNCAAENARYISELMAIAREHDLKDMGKDATPVYSVSYTSGPPVDE